LRGCCPPGRSTQESRHDCARCQPTSLRAKRSNPESVHGGSLDCFGARAPRNDGANRLVGIVGWAKARCDAARLVPGPSRRAHRADRDADGGHGAPSNGAGRDSAAAPLPTLRDGSCNAPIGQIVEPSQADLACPVLLKKRNHLRRRANQVETSARPASFDEGRYAIVTKRWGWDAMAATWRSVLDTRTNAMVRTVKSQRPGLPMLRSSLERCAFASSRDDGGKQAGRRGDCV